MATTFSGPVVSLKGFIGGPNPNAGSRANDTEQGGKTPFSVTNVTTLSDGTTTLLATQNEGVMVYVSDAVNATTAGYAFSNGTTWKQMNAPDTDVQA